MKKLLAPLEQVPEFGQMISAMDGGRCPVGVSGLSGVHRAHFAAALWEKTQRPVVILCPDEGEAGRMARDVAAFSGQPVLQLPGREFTFHNAATVSRQWEHRRLSVLRAMDQGAPFVVATSEGMLQRTMPPEVLRGAVVSLGLGSCYDLNRLAEQLTIGGYSRCDQVEGPGQFALRGGILDVYSPALDAPVRAEFYGDEIDSMGLFDVSTQRRTENLKQVELLPAAETLPQLAPGGVLGLVHAIEELRIRLEKKRGVPAQLLATMEEDSRRLAELGLFPAADRYMALIYPKMAGGVDYIPPDAIVLYAESARVQESGKNYLWRLEEDVNTLLESGHLWGDLARFSHTREELAQRLEEFPVAYLDTFPVSSYPTPPRELLAVMAKQLPSFGASLETAVSDLAHYQKENTAVVVLCANETRAKALANLLYEQRVKVGVDLKLHDLPARGKCVIGVGGLSAGLEYPTAGFAILTEGQAAPAKKKAPGKVTNRQKLDSYADLSPGDLVVHEHHGIARFVEMVKMPLDGVEKDYVKLSFAGTDCLYVPATQLDLISKYIGSGEEGSGAKLSKLGGTDWAKAKSRAKAAARDLAKGLIQLYAQRQREAGYAFGPDDPWQREFEDRFEYQETDDQLRCVEEIKADMERPIPMDRLLCGDVGYGKTEVALRAAMKCVLEGKQAAILVPTTVLAQQHFQTATQRFAGYPIRIALMSRYRTAKQMKLAAQELERGEVDVLIGTHRLLQKDVQFKDLGLLIIDEEQRFGVTHKERLKEMARQVDVLTLSATPIPRTLNMALSGIRDMSTIEQPPQDRQPVQTYVLEHDWSVLADAMRREIGRGGQVYYLHNRVETITRAAALIRETLGDEVSVGIAHGKMGEEEINEAMSRMVAGETQVLVCTTIIETGIDISNVNTLIIEDADKLGLAQLHQIRGRVGRSPRRAFAYLTYRRGKVLTEIAAKRLGAIREFAEFGSGFKIAMRDLEIRGAGNLLGPEQSGFLISVGYDMYLKLLEEAVLEERGETPVHRTECAADLAVSANIPDRYVPSPEQRMDLYRRIARVRSEEDADDVVDELIDRYGDPPRSVNNLISVALLRAAAARCGISDIGQKGGSMNFALERFELRHVAALCGEPTLKGRVLFAPGERPCISLRVKKGEDVLQLGQKMVACYEKLCAEEASAQ